MTLVILSVFMIMMAAAAGLINRQFNQVVGQEQEEQAFQIAESGVSYALWLMDEELVDFNSPQGITDYEVQDQTVDPPEVLGTFDLTFQTLSFTPGQSVAIRVVAEGEDLVLTTRKQTIEATIQSDDLDNFRVIEWDHKP